MFFLFFFMKISSWIPKYGLQNLFVISFAFAVIRWLLISFFADNVIIVIIATLFHAVTYGMYHAVSISLIHEYFTGDLQGRGQAMYSSISFGLGGSIGSFYSGYLADAAFTTHRLITEIEYVFSTSSCFVAHDLSCTASTVFLEHPQLFQST